MIVLKRMIFSDIELEQREFNILGDIYRSGFKRTGKKYIGKARRSIGDKLAQMERNQKAANIKAGRKLMEMDQVAESNKDLGINLAKEANKRGIRIFDKNRLEKVRGGNKLRNYLINWSDEGKEQLKEQYPNFKNRTVRKVAAHLINKGKAINIRGNYDKSASSITHEIGHDMNEDNMFTRFVTKLTDFEPKKYKHDARKSGLRNEIGSIMNSAKDKVGTFIRDTDIPQYLEERNAWNNASKLMKKVGASEKEMKTLNERKKAALDTYKSGILGNKINKLRRKIQIESNDFNVNKDPATSKRIRKTKRTIAKNRRNGE